MIPRIFYTDQGNHPIFYFFYPNTPICREAQSERKVGGTPAAALRPSTPLRSPLSPSTRLRLAQGDVGASPAPSFKTDSRFIF